MGFATASTLTGEKLKTRPWEHQGEEYGCNSALSETWALPCSLSSSPLSDAEIHSLEILL